ncbi:MAG TPA: DUF72 domain-containing protein [Alphaproteobacteria bacterium]|nr:DUF72 domain-containing protein [Alphaproteobacteria bacterium]
MTGDDPRIGCAGWRVPKQHAVAFPASGSHLARYAGRFDAVEIDTSFRRQHRHATYKRWAATVPTGFAFAVKAPAAVTHAGQLGEPGEALDDFLDRVGGLGDKLGPLLFQFPPRRAFEADAARAFFAGLRTRFDGWAVCEPRHASWFAAAADRLLAGFHIARVAADPAPAAGANEPGGWPGLVYVRLHGMPRVYYSAYGPERLAGLAERLARARGKRRPVWCIFDNTAAGEATTDALALQRHVRGISPAPAAPPRWSRG